MYFTNIELLNKKIAHCGMSMEAIVKEIGGDKSKFYRRLKNNKLLVGDMHKISNILKLSNSEAKEIFLSRFPLFV